MLIICEGSPIDSYLVGVANFFILRGHVQRLRIWKKRRKLLINKTEGNIKFIGTETAHMTLHLLAQSEQFIFRVSQLGPSGENFKL